ncbi:sugar ABC transporter ATP-binding protein [Arthrobacter sp. AB6]|uniref:sugar ABC transporter ATP-binding protein n=1 Tax=Arthrobacter sp. AB6 TaxID=2962570 RepID=UPI002881D531|nr:sugar ABC transporter ATP-binding protein [Arthrobacter sp. AB6]MDT0196456.1 sugar ABC transporter ATP-binding protein [Arthrobacter sp. AB6]
MSSVVANGAPLLPEQEMTAPSLEMRGIDVIFGTNQILYQADLLVRAGSVHSLLGANGAGKSTLMKVATGHVLPHSGHLAIGGKSVKPGSVQDSTSAGLGMVYQDLSLVPSLSAADNVFLGRPHTLSRTGILKRGSEVDEAAALFERLGISIDPRAEVASLGLADRQVIEIAKALTSATACLILDEPTTALSAHEVERLFQVVYQLKQTGMGIVFITHHLQEVFDICDDVTVLRDGKPVLSSAVRETTMADIVSGIVATDVPSAAESSGRKSHEGTKPALAVSKVSFKQQVRQVDFEARPGEIVGIAGLSGSGSNDFLRALAGVAAGATGHMTLDGKQRRVPQSPLEAAKQGIYLIPGNRKAEGLILGASVQDNIALSVLPELRRGPFMSSRKGADLADHFMKDLSIKATSASQLVDELSGGNQQKVVLAKAIATNAKVLLLEEPTFGVDIHASAEIANQIRALVNHGATCLWLTNDLRELREATDRIVVFVDGEITQEFANSKETSESDLLQAMHAINQHATSEKTARAHHGEVV